MRSGSNFRLPQEVSLGQITHARYEPAGRAAILFGVLALATCAVLALAGNSVAGPPARLPELRLSTDNGVPTCATPARLMRFLTERNTSLDPRYRRIAAVYRQHGEANRVRWDYAFFQMLVETNYLTFRKGDGRPGDVKPAQNNFAGIGTTGGGVPGDSYPDVSTGVLAQIQHLMVYSGERLDAPVAPRTRLKQDDIISASRRLGRRVTFQDLAGRWAADRRYGRTLLATADRFFGSYCNGPDTSPDEGLTPPARGDVVAHSGGGSVARPSTTLVGASATSSSTSSAAAARVDVAASAPPILTASQPCKVFTASYGGEAAVLIGAPVGAGVHYTAVQVLPGFEASLARSYIAEHARGGQALGQFPSRRDALMRAFALCPGSSTATAVR